MESPASHPAGWYADPSGHHHHRYWDGQAWTEHISGTAAPSLGAPATFAVRSGVQEGRLADLQYVQRPIAARYRRSFVLWFVSIALFWFAADRSAEPEAGYNIWNWVLLGALCLWIISLVMWLSVRKKRKAINAEIANVRGTLGLTGRQPPVTTNVAAPHTAPSGWTEGFYALDLGYLTGVVDAHDANTLILNFKYRPQHVGSPAFHQLLENLGLNASATIARLRDTRPIDGTQTADGTKARAYWTYHLDEGLKIVFERK